MFSRIHTYLTMIKFSHSVFALPFALTAAFFAAEGFPSLRQLFWIIVAMIGARSAAMGMNRIIDRRIDLENPRTKNREIPSGVVRVRDAMLFVIISFSVMVFAAFMLNALCLQLSPVAIIILIMYSYTKRFTYLSHVILGIAISGAPLGAWIAVRGTLDANILPLVLAVVFWLAGFDILYALQDIEFDTRHGLYSIPQKFGIKKALIIARSFHLVTWILLGVSGCIFDTGVIYFAGIVFVGLLLLYEHSLVKEYDLSNLDMAFFNMNGYISITVFAVTCIDLLMR